MQRQQCFLLSWLDGTVMSVGRSSSLHAHLQAFQTHIMHFKLCGFFCHIIMCVILINVDHRKNLLELNVNTCWKSTGSLLHFKSDYVYNKNTGITIDTDAYDVCTVIYGSGLYLAYVLDCLCHVMCLYHVQIPVYTAYPEKRGQTVSAQFQ